MINKKIFILIYYLLILFFKSENIFKETMGGMRPPQRVTPYFTPSLYIFSRVCV